MKSSLIKIFKFLKGTGKTAHKSVKGGLDFIDDLLEEEPIIKGVENVKETAGKIIEKSGEYYEKTRMKIEDLSSTHSEDNTGEEE